MTLFKYELKQLKTNLIVWALCMGGLIFLMHPTYIGFTAGSDAAIMDLMNDNAIFDILGVDAGFIMAPLGMFSFLNGFAMIAAAIHGMSIAFSSHTKEYTSKSAEFLLTKPHSRGKVFWAKFAACVIAVWIVGFVYMVGAALALLTVNGASIDWLAFILIAKTLPLVALMFVVFGTLAGTFFSKVRTPALISSCVMLVLFCLSAMSKKINVPILGYLTPFSFFTPLRIIETKFYEWNFVIWYFILGTGLLLICYKKFIKKDIVF
ncbi:MAG: ABC transporter permease [Fibromonadaceae bacterium]|jgi:ABC-2 type transport system permease protein|nr:ABC transporter permease [Fibromonadaceae bacterium]